MMTHIAHGLGLMIDVATYPHTIFQHRRERQTGDIHLTAKEWFWLQVYHREFFCDRPQWLWRFLLEAFAL